ncbi:MFS family permease [Bacillus horti]|uniref:MFS family permease n=1 Tax=Caldalkalibacillus horti TaxID=77523 RepID=A0ABT9W2Q5_9BACI|nr:MFS family permease [Bacillus horti]
MFAIRKILANVGIALASILGAILIHFDFIYISLASAAIFIFISILSYIRLPEIYVQTQHIPFESMWRTVIKDRHFVTFTLITIGYYFMYMQLFLTIPIHAVQITNHPQAVSLVLLLFSFTIILCQYFISKWMTRFELIFTLKLGFGLMGIGLVLLGSTNFLSLFICGMLLFSFGVMISEPTTFDLISRFAKPALMASYYGFASLGMALGGGLSQGLGGGILQIGVQNNFPSLLWWCTGFVALLSIVGLHFLGKSMGSHNPPASVGTLKAE